MASVASSMMRTPFPAANPSALRTWGGGCRKALAAFEGGAGAARSDDEERGVFPAGLEEVADSLDERFFGAYDEHVDGFAFDESGDGLEVRGAEGDVFGYSGRSGVSRRDE